MSDGFTEGVLLACVIHGGGADERDAMLAGFTPRLRPPADRLAGGREGVARAGARLHPGLERAMLEVASPAVRALVLPQLGPRAREAALAVAVPRRGFRAPAGLSGVLVRLLRDDRAGRVAAELAELAELRSGA